MLIVVLCSIYCSTIGVLSLMYRFVHNISISSHDILILGVIRSNLGIRVFFWTSFKDELQLIIKSGLIIIGPMIDGTVALNDIYSNLFLRYFWGYYNHSRSMKFSSYKFFTYIFAQYQYTSLNIRCISWKLPFLSNFSLMYFSYFIHC